MLSHNSAVDLPCSICMEQTERVRLLEEMLEEKNAIAEYMAGLEGGDRCAPHPQPLTPKL